MTQTKLFIGTGVVLFLLLAAGSFFVSNGADFSIGDMSLILQDETEELPQKLAHPPEEVRGIYVTSWVAGSSRMDDLIDLITSTELNAVVIDVKDATGYISFPTNIALASEIGAHERRIADIDALIRELHEHQIYVIGRVQVFQDPILAQARPDLAVQDARTGDVWRDNKGLAWLDPSHPEVWEYTTAIATEMSRHGFDEVNLDYIRFPSDGALEHAEFPVWDGTTPRYQVIRSFFSYMRAYADKHNIRLSADIFGMTTLFTQRQTFDLYIGQRLIDALETFHTVSPMVYPSHYGPGVLGLAHPAEHPYAIVYASMQEARALQATTTGAAQLRPWLQDFDIGAVYGPAEIRAQIQAAYDAGINEWLLWNPASRYTRSALLPAE